MIDSTRRLSRIAAVLGTSAVLLGLAASVHAADPVPASRLPFGGTWQGIVGVRDVDPTTRTKSGSTLPAGSTPAQITAAINAANPGQYVELAAGTFNFPGDFVISKSSVTLRGQVDANGRPTTILNFSSGHMYIHTTGWDFSNAAQYTTITINSGATRGSTSVTIASAPSGLSAGMLMFITAPTNAPTIDGGGWTNWFGGRPYSAAHRVTSVGGNTISFTPAINADYLSGVIQVSYRSASSQIDFVGLENLSFTATGGYFGSEIVRLEGANQSWIRNCTFTGVGDGSSLNAAVYWYCSYGCELSHSEVFDAHSFGSSTYGICSAHSHGLLIVNNYFHHLPNVFPLLATGGSAFAYNYFTDEPYQVANWLSQIVFFHGSHSHYNLFEGNWVASHYNDDTNSGNFSHSRNSLYVRQRMLGWDATGPKDSNTNAITLTNHHDNVTVAANVMGHTGTQATYNGSNAIFNVDSVSDATLARLGNYNTVNNGIPAAETSALAGGAVAASYLYSSKPSWFGNLPWPWVDPNNYTQSNNPQNFPAGYRAANGVDPSGTPPPSSSPWSGILDPARATDWSMAGVEGGIPSAAWPNCTTAACNTLFGGNVTATTLTNAINSAPNNSVVRIPAGTFSLNGFQISRSNVAVRGAGANQTFLTITNGSPTGCGTFFGNAIAMCTGSSTRFSQNWTAGFAQGTTQITLASVGGLTVGQPIFLTQDDDTTDWPGPGDVNVCATQSTSCSATGGGSTYFQPLTADGNSSYSAYKVTAINGNIVTISPGLILPNYRPGRNGKAVWYSNGTFLQNAGLEDLSFDFSALTNNNGVLCVYCYNTWEKGVRSIAPQAPTNTPHHINYVLSYRNTAQSNYWYGPEGTSGAINQYTLSQYFGFANIWENNIIQQRQAALVTDAPMTGSVYAYNFLPGRPDPGVVLHAAGESMNLYEGNVMLGFYGDIVHGSHFFETVFRNALVGHRYAAAPFGTVQDLVHLQTKNRFFNIIGNVLGDTSYINTYETTLVGSGASVYNLGWKGNNSGADPGTDTNVKRTLMRWGNWDSVNNATRWVASEVPSDIPNFANPIPASQTLPASFYLSARPSWWPAVKPWPAIGPDVTGGNIANMGGHAYTNSAADCYLSVMGGPANGSGGPLSFNANTCYGAGSPPATACDLNNSGSTDVTDVQLCVNQAIGVSSCSTGDINNDNQCNVVDVQRVVNAALGGQCVTQ